MLRTILAAAAAVTTVLACPDHVYNSTSLGKRQTVVEATDWAYEASYNWGTIREGMFMQISYSTLFASNPY